MTTVARFSDDLLKTRYYVLIHPQAVKALRMADMLARRVILKRYADPEQEISMDATMTYPGYVSGHFEMVVVDGMELMTTFSGERKPKAHLREAKAREQVLGELDAMIGAQYPRTNTGDGIRRRWMGVKSHHGE